MSTETTEIIAEGLRLLIVRLFDAGQRNEAVMDIIATNSRLPDFVRGDLWAQVSAGRRVAKSIEKICDSFGIDAPKCSHFQSAFCRHETRHRWVKSTAIRHPSYPRRAG